MNNFSTLDAQSPLASLIQVASNESLPVQVTGHGSMICNNGLTRSKASINRTKLALHNLCQPMHKRIEASKLSARVSVAKMRGNAVALLARVKAEIAAKPQTDAQKFYAE